MTTGVAMRIADVRIVDGIPEVTHSNREAVYFNGSYGVFQRYRDADIEWLVAPFKGGMARAVPLDKYEAIRLADDMKDADDRAAREAREL